MTTQLAPNSMSLPPPTSPELDLRDGDRVVGWISGRAAGYRGFANESEAAGAAWVAHRSLSRRLARRHGGRPAPIDVEPLSITRDGDHEAILASNRPIATLLRPGVDSPIGSDSFGFEIQVPLPGGELTMRSIAYRIYRTLRTSGVPWAMWNGRRVATAPRVERRQPVRVPAPRPIEHSPSAMTFLARFLFTSIAIVMGAAVIAAAPRTVTIPLGIVLAAGLVASGVVAMIERWRAPGRARPAPPRHRAPRQRNDDPSEESMHTFGWMALGGVSIALLVLALIVPQELAIALGAIGLVGLSTQIIPFRWRNE